MELVQFIDKLKENRHITSAGEEATKQGAILPILARLGWDRDDVRQVVPEYTVGSGRVDYCLRIGEQSKVFIEAKRASEDLDRHQEQLLEYAFRDGVEIAVLTSGFTWWFYLPLFKGSWAQRKFLAVDIGSLDSSRASQHFREFLSFEDVANGQAYERAKTLHASKAKEIAIRETIPSAWVELCQEPDELLLELFAEKVESLCGHRPDEEALAEFLFQNPNRNAAGVAVAPQFPQSVQPIAAKPMSAKVSTGYRRMGYTGKRVLSFTFRSHTVPVRTFKEVLIGLSETLARTEGDRFSNVLELQGRQRPYFTRTESQLRLPVKVGKSGIFVETNLSANNIVQLCLSMLDVLRINQSDFRVETN